MSAEAKWPWSVLGLDKMPPEAGDVRRAYARALKKIDQSKDIEGFATLRAAYEHALAQREGRTVRALDKQAIKAAARAEPVPVAAPVEVLAPDPELIKAQAQEVEFFSQLQTLDSPNLLQTLEQRVNTLLDSPLRANPARNAALRDAIARMLRSKQQHWEAQLVLDRSVTRDLLQRLDHEFGWLSDFTAFRRDFWGDMQLQHLLLERHAGGILPLAIKRSIKRGPLGRVLAWMFRHPTLFAFFLLGTFVLISVLMQAFPGLNLAKWLLLPFGAGVLAMAAGGLVVWTQGVYQRVYHRHSAGLAAGITLLGIGTLLAGYGPGDNKSLGLAALLVVVLALGGRLLGPKRAALLETRLQRMFDHVAFWRR